MLRFHVNVSVADIGASTRFYNTLFGVEPTVLKDDYAKWMLDEPRINFVISGSANASGVNHIGLQAGLVKSHREGRHVRYRADYDTIQSLVLFLMEDCCQGKAEVCRPVAESLAV